LRRPSGSFIAIRAFEPAVGGAMIARRLGASIPVEMLPLSVEAVSRLQAASVELERRVTLDRGAALTRLIAN
jgi:hypothetical protein